MVSFCCETKSKLNNRGVSKDDDFTALSSLHGHPPRLIKLSLGNCTNDQVLDALVRQQPTIAAAFVDPAIAMVELVPSGE